MPVTSPPTIIAPYEPVPNPNQGRTDFNTNMQATFNRWPETSASQEAMGAWMEETANQTETWAGEAEAAVGNATSAGDAQVQLAAAQAALASDHAGDSEDFASDAANSALIAAAAANMLGTWTAYGANPIAAFAGMLKHDGSYYIPLVPLADASSVEPGTDPATWEDYIALVSGGLTKVTSNTDTTSGNVVDVAWLASRGIGLGHNADGRTFTNPSDLANLGFVCGRCDGELLGISGLTGSDIGVVTIEAQASDTSVAGTVALTFKRGSQIWVRSNTNATTWAGWSRLRGAAEIPTVAEGGTNSTTAADARTALEAAGNGAVTGSGLTMTSARMLGRTTASTGAIEQLTGAQVLSFAGGAAAGRVADTGITSATARMVGRIAASTGPLAELTAADVLTFLGVATTSVTVPGASNWVTAPTRVDMLRIGGRVRAVVYITCSGSSTASTAFSALIPSGWRPAAQQVLRTMVIPTGLTGEWPASVTFSFNGDVTFNRASSESSASSTYAVIEWAI